MIIVRYGEIALKGGNRKIFEDILKDNVKQCLKKNNISFDKIVKSHGRLFVYTDEKFDEIKNIFGIVSYSYAKVCDSDIESIKQTVSHVICDFDEKTKFRVTTQRSNKGHKKTSMEIDREIGAYVVEKTKAKVNLKNFDKEICIEIVKDKAYVFSEKKKAVGGLPLGSAGKLLCLLEDRKDIYAAFLMMKRGCPVVLLNLGNIAYDVLEKYSCGAKLENIKISNKKEIKEIAEKHKINAVVVGQTLDEVEQLDIGLVEFRPLVGMTKEEIEKKLDELQNN